MFIFFGSKTLTKTLGEYQISGTCPNCHNTINLQIAKEADWFTLYFIPVFPFNIRYYKLCPICHAGARITKQEAFNLLGK